MIGQQMPASFDAARACEPTMLRAAHSAERTAYEISKGKPFNCVRGQGRITVEECRKRFESKNTICMRDCGCSIMATKKDILEKKPMPKRGICSECGDGPMHLVSGRCYKCRQRSTLPPAASKSSTPAKTPPKSITPAQKACDDDQRVGPRVKEAGEKLRNAIESDKCTAPDACQGRPVPAERLVVSGMQFEAVDLKLARAVTPEVRIKKNGVFFVADAVRRFGLDRFRAFRVYRAKDALGLEFLTEWATDAMAISRSTKSSASMCSGSSIVGKLFPELVGRTLPMETTNRPGFFLARVG